ncbi:MAG: hypothetical protein V4492_05975 [Chlamydiota bacterium]
MNRLLICACISIAAVLNADPASHLESPALMLSPDELVLVSKLTDHNRKTFAEKLTADQRKAVMIAFENGALPDEAVHRMVTAGEAKERGVIGYRDVLSEEQ